MIKSSVSCILRYSVLLFFLLGISVNSWAQKTWIGATGSWNTPANWSGGTLPVAGDDVVIPVGAVVTINGTVPAVGSLASLSVAGNLTTENANHNVTIAGSLTVSGVYDLFRSILVVNGSTSVIGTGTLSDNNNNGSNTFNGNIINNGFINFIGTSAVSLGGTSFSNNGTCSIAGTVNVTSDLAISGSTLAAFSSVFNIASGKTVTNSNISGVSIGGNLNGDLDNTSKFINTTTLNYAGATVPMLNGTLDVSAGGNTINYNLNAAQAIAGVNYYNLIFSGTGTKTLQGDAVILGQASFLSGILQLNGKTLTLKGATAVTSGSITGSTTSNLIIASSDNAGMVLPTINGGLLNFTVNKTGSTNTVALSAALTVNGIATFTSGALVLNGNTFSLAGTGTISPMGGYIIGSATSSINLASSDNTTMTLPVITGGLQNFTINKTGTNPVVLLGSPVSVAGTLSLTNGLLVLGTNDLTLGVSASAVGGTPSVSKMIVADGTGQMKKVFAAGASGAYTFPVGDMTSANDYSPVSLTFTANSVQRTIGVRVTDAQHPNDGSVNDFLSRYWSFTDDQAGTYTYNASFSYSSSAPSDLTGTHANTKVNRYNGGWTQYTTSGAAPTLTLSGASETTGLLNGSDFTGRVNIGSYTWNQTGGTADWTVATNWTPTRLSPQPTDILTFSNSGTTTATNVPNQTIGRLVISGNSNVSLQSSGTALITISGASGTNLDVQSGSTLQLSSIGTDQLTMAFAAPTQTVSVAGSLIINANTGTSNTFKTTNSITSVSGSIINNGGTITSSAADLIFVAGSVYNHARDAGTIPTATWNVTSNCNITGLTSSGPAGINQTFGNLSINCPSLTTATTIASGVTTVQGNLLIQGTSPANTVSLDPAGNNFTVIGSTTVNAYGILTDSNNAGTNSFGNVVINSGGFLITGNSSPYIFNGTINNSGTINKTGTGTITFNGNSLVNNGLCTLAGNVTVNSDLTISGSTLATFSNNVTIASSKTVTNSNTVGITISGALIGNADNTSKFINATTLNYSGTASPMANGTLDASTTGNIVNYSLGAAQAVKSTLYHHLTISGSAGTKTMQGNVTVNGNLWVYAGTTLDLGTVASSFNVLQSAQIDGTLLYNTSMIKTVSIGGNLTGTGVLNTSGGNLSHILNLGGAINSIGTLTSSATAASVVNYNGVGTQQVFSSANYRALLISGTGDKLFQGPVSATDVTVNSGVLKLNGQTLTTTGNIMVASGAELNLDANAKLLVASGKTVTNNGTFTIVGASGSPAIMDRNGTGNYAFTQNSGAVLKAGYYQINYLNNGLNILPGSSIDNANNLSNGSFSGGTGSQYVNLQNVDLTSFTNPVSNVVFNAGPGYNINRNTGTGSITFEDASGSFAGENYDNDNGNPGTLVNWTTPSTTYYSRANGVSAGLTTSWTHNPDGSGANPLSVTDGTVSLIVKDGHTVVVDNQGDLNVLKLQIGQGSSGVLRIGEDATARSVTVKELLEVKTGGNFQASSAGGHKLLIYGNFINNGTTNLRINSSILANTEIYGNTTITGASIPVFSDLTFKTGSTVTPSVALDINGNVSFETNSKFIDNGLTHTVAGNWNVDGTGIYTATGTIEFDGLLNTINNGTATSVTFNNVTFKGGGLGSIQETTTIQGNLYITNNTTVTPGNIIVTSNGNFTVDAGATYSQTSNTTLFSGTAAQSINLQGTTSFYAITFNNGGTNAKTVTGNIIAANLVTVSSGATVDGTGDHIFSSGFRMDGTCNWAGSITLKGGNLASGKSSITLGTAILNIAGWVTEVVTAPATALTVNVNNDVNIVSGTLTINDQALLIGDGTHKLTVTSALTLLGTNNFPSNFSVYDLAQASTVSYSGIMNQTVKGGITYGTLATSGTSTRKTADGPLDVNGNLTLTASTILDLGTYSHTFSGAINNGTNSSIDGPNATVTLDADNAAQVVQASGTGSYTFKNLYLTLNGATATWTKIFNAGSTINITGGDVVLSNAGGSPSIKLIVDLTTNGILGTPKNLQVGEYCQLNTAHSDFGSAVTDHFTGTKSFEVNSTVYYNLNGDQLVADGFAYGNLLLGTGNKTGRGNLDINGSISASGTPVFYDGGFIHTVAGDWLLSNTAYYTQASATGTIVLDGLAQTVNGVNFNNLTVSNTGLANVTSGLTIYGNLTVNAGAKIDVSTQSINLKGNFAVNGNGLFTQTSGTTTFSGTTTQTILSNATSYLGNFVINKPNAAGNQTVKVNSEFHVTGGTTITSDAGVLDISGQDVYFSGSLYVYNNTVEPGSNFIATSGNTFFDGVNNQVIRNTNTNPLTLNNVKFSGSGNKTIYAYTPNLAPTASTVLNINGNVNISGANVSANATGGNPGMDLHVLGNWLNTGTFTHGNYTVYFEGADQTISSSQFGNLDIRGTNTKTLTGDITVNSNLIITTATLDANNNNIVVAGNWDNSSATAAFIPRTGKVTFNGGSVSVISTGTTTGPASGKSFYNLDINKSGNYASQLGDLDVKNDFTVSSGIFYAYNAGVSYNMWVAGNFTNAGTFNHGAASILNLVATGGNKVFKPSELTTTTISGLVMNAPGTVYTTQSDFIISNTDPQLQAGELVLNGKKLTINNNNRAIAISGGTLNVNAASDIEFTGTGQKINMSSGNLKLVGSAVYPIQLNKATALNPFLINVTGGILSAQYYVINNGTLVMTGGSIDATNNLSNGNFKGCTNLNGSYITLTGFNFPDFTVNKVTFNSTAATFYNVTRTAGTGTVTFNDASGSKAGEMFDVDNGNPGTLVNWSFPAGFYWDRGANTDDWHDALNWTSNTVPTASDIAYLNHDYYAPAYTVKITSNDAVALRVVTDAQSSNAITLQLENDKKLTVGEHLQIGASTTLTQTASTNIITVGGNWVNAGTFNNGNSTVILNGKPGTYVLNPGGIGSGKSFFNLTLNADSATYSLASPMDVNGNFTANDGTLDVALATNTINVGGNWFLDYTKDAKFIPSTGTVNFNGSSQTVTNGTFYSLSTLGSGTKQFLSNIDVNNDLTIGASTTLDGLQNTVYVARNWINNGTFTQTGLGTIIFDGTGAQQIDNGSSVTSFNYLTFQNGGLKTFYKASAVNADLSINSGAYVNADTYTLNGVGGNNTFTNYGSFEMRGTSNFPTGFENMFLANTSNTIYRADIPQTVYPTTYGNLTLRNLSGVASTKTADGDLNITGSLFLNSDNNTVFDVNKKQSYIKLTGTVYLNAGCDIIWGKGASTLEHVGADWYIPASLDSVNNLILAGTGTKFLMGNLLVAGNVRVKTNIGFCMYAGWNSQTNYRTMKGGPSRTFTLETGSRLYASAPASYGPAVPENFGTYDFDSNSSYSLNSLDAVDQTIFTGSNIKYGNLYFNNIKNVTSDGLGELVVKGIFNISIATYNDNNKNIRVAGSDIYLTNYTPTPGVTFTLDGSANQYVRDDQGTSLLFSNVVFSGNGIKTIGDGNDDISIGGNLLINSLVAVTTGRNITHAGALWTNNGYFRHTANTLTFAGLSNQTINPGTPNANNYFSNLTFVNPSTKTFVTNGSDIRGSLLINDGTVNLGTLVHKITGNITNISGGTLVCGNADINFYGGNQNINTPAFAVNNVTLSTNGTKRMFSDWTINGNLLVNSGVVFSTSDAVIPTFYNIFIKGNWTNNGTFTVNTSKVTFNGNSPSISIQSGGSNFYDVDFTPGASASYSLVSATTRISRSMNLNSGATLNLSSHTLILGSNLASGKIFNVAGTLNVNENAFLKVNNQGSQSVINITSGGRFRLVGTDMSNIATLSREVAGIAGSETQFNVLSGATMEARYYLVEYMQDAGMNLAQGSSLDASNNFSDGTWSNIRNVANVRYLTLESDYSGASLNNITFNYSGTPVQGTHFNVKRELASTPVVFNLVYGNLGSYKFEDDDEAVASATSGKLQWPGVTLTNWTGAINTNWHVPGNWDNGVPTLAIDAVIPDRSNDPVIFQSDAVCKNLTITNGTLAIQGHSLTTSGDVTIGTGASTGILSVQDPSCVITVGGMWTRGTAGFFAHGNGTVIFNSGAGAATITPLSSNFYNVVFDNPLTMFSLSGSTINIKGSVNVLNGDVVPATNAYTYNIDGDFLINGGTFSPVYAGVSSGLVALTGNGAQTIYKGNFYNLNVAGSGTKLFQDTTIVNGATTVSSIMKADANSIFDFNGNVTINSGATFNDGDQSHTFSGQDWRGNGIYSGNGTVVFDRTSGTQNVYKSVFNNLDLKSPSVTINIQDAVDIRGDLIVRNGSNSVNTQSFLINNTSGTGTLTMEDNTRLYVYGANNFPKGFATYALSPTSNTYYYGASDQDIDGVSYGNLNFNNINTKTLKGDITVQGALTLNNSTLDVSANNYSITLAGNWNNNNNGNFICQSGEVIFNGSSNQSVVFGGSSENKFYDLTVDKLSGYVLANQNTTNDFIIQGNLKVNSGQFHANGRVIYVGGDLLATGGGTFVNSGQYYLNKTSGNASIQTNGSTLNGLTINSSGSANYTLADNLSVVGNFKVMSGTFDGNGKYASLGSNSGSVVVIDGTYKVGAGGTLALGWGVAFTVNNTGTVEVVGNNTSIARVTNNTTNGRYTFVVNGTIKARNYLFEFMAADGVYISPSATIDPTYNLSYGTFTNGSGTGALLRIENTQDLKDANRIVGVSFPQNAGGSSSNVAKVASTTGTVEFYDASGVFAGEALDNDPSDHIIWTGPIVLTWNGSQSTDWNTAANWTASYGPGFVPTGNENVFIAAAVNQPILTTFGAQTRNLTINTGAMVTLNTPADAGNIDLNIQGDLLVNGMLRMMSAGDYVATQGNWTKAATGNMSLNNGNVIFNGSGGSKTINNGNSPFYNVTISGSSQYQLGAAATINGNLLIDAGAMFNVSANNYDLNIKGDWTNNGTFIANSGKVIFMGTVGPRNIFAGSSSFNDVDINGTGVTYKLTGDASVLRNLNIIAGTLDVNGHKLIEGDGTGSDNLSVSGTLIVGDNAILQLGNLARISVNSGGSFKLVASSKANAARITSASGGRYTFDVNSGASIAAKYYTVEYGDVNGLYIHNGANVDPANNFSEGIFSYGYPGSGVYLRLEHEPSSNDTVKNVTFNIGPLYNVSRTAGTAIFFFQDPSGALGSFDYENDNGVPDPSSGLLQWTAKDSYYWTGNIDTDWHKTGNWSGGKVPDITKSAIIPATAIRFPNISTGTASVKKLTVNSGANLTVSKDLTIAEDFYYDGAVTASGSPLITVGENWNSTSGSFTPGTSAVLLSSTSGTKIITLGTGYFYNLEINAPSVTYLIAANLSISNNLKITSGTFNMNNYNLSVGGSLVNSGTLVTLTKKVTFNGTGAGSYSIIPGGSSFYDLEINSGTGLTSYLLGGNLSILHNFTLTKGTIDMSPDAGTTSYNLTIGNRLAIAGGTFIARNANIQVGENFAIGGTGIFTAGTSTVNLVSASGTRTVTTRSNALYNLLINGAATFRLSDNLLILKDLTANNGTLDLAMSPSFNLTVGGNWVNNAIFSSRTGWVTFNGTSQAFSGNALLSLYNMAMDNGTVLTVNRDVQVSNTFKMNGTVNTLGNILTLGTSTANPGTLVYTSGIIVGKFERWINTLETDYLFPVGTISQRQSATMRFIALTPGSLMMEFISSTPGTNGIPANDPPAVVSNVFSEGFWRCVAKNALASNEYNVSLDGVGFTSYPLNGNTRILKRTDAGNWFIQGAHFDMTGSIAHRSTLNALSFVNADFCLGSVSCSGGTVGNDQTICQGSDLPAFINTYSPSGGTSYSYVWQYTTSATAVPGDSNWTDIPTSNSLTIDYGVISQKSKFVRKATSAGCPVKYSNVITIEVWALPHTGPVYRLPNQ